MFCLTTFRRGMAPAKVYGEEDALYQEARDLQAQGVLTAWRIVNLASGTCTLYYKEGENKNEPAYR